MDKRSYWSNIRFYSTSYFIVGMIMLFITFIVFMNTIAMSKDEQVGIITVMLVSMGVNTLFLVSIQILMFSSLIKLLHAISQPDDLKNYAETAPEEKPAEQINEVK